MVSKDGTSERTPIQEVALLNETLPGLEKAFKDAVVAIERARGDKNANILELAKVALAAESLVSKAKAKVGSFQYKIDNASRIAKQGEVGRLVESIQTAVSRSISGHQASTMKGLEVTGFTINVTTSDNGDLEVGVKASGPGVVAARKSGGGGGGGRGRSTLGNGDSWAGIASEHGLDPKGASAHKVVKTRLPEVHDAIPHDCTI